MALKISREESAAEDRNTKIEDATTKIGGGNSTGITAIGIPTFSKVFIIITMIKGGSSPMDYGFVAIISSISLVFFVVLSAI
jgi:hypothetical protein